MGYIARTEDKKNACCVLVGKLEGEEPPGRTQHKWKDSV
jgi:hypothetical protein